MRRKTVQLLNKKYSLLFFVEICFPKMCCDIEENKCHSWNFGIHDIYRNPIIRLSFETPKWHNRSLYFPPKSEMTAMAISGFLYDLRSVCMI